LIRRLERREKREVRGDWRQEKGDRIIAECQNYPTCPTCPTSPASPRLDLIRLIGLTERLTLNARLRKPKKGLQVAEQTAARTVLL